MQPPARALWFVAPRRVEIGSIEVVEPEEGEALVETLFSGISSGTELLAFRGQIDPDLPLDDTIGALGGTFRYPFRYGYSCVGTVTRSRSPIPEGSLVFAFHPHQDRFVAPAVDLVVLEGHAREATLFPLVETALQIVLDAGPVLGTRVAVFGLGAVGATTALLLRRSGARVVAIDPSPWRRDLVKALGDRDLATVDPADAHSAIESGGGPVPLVIEASGNPAALDVGLDLLAHEGVALVASWYGAKQVQLPLGGAFHRRRLTIRSTQVSTIPARLAGSWDMARRHEAVVGLLAELPLSQLASHVYPFDEAGKAYAALDRSEDGIMHVALEYR